MSFLHNLRLRLSPPRITDPEFGNLIWMYISNHPERSYWEGHLSLPGTGTVVEVFLPGGESGPLPDARQFYLGIPGRYEQILTACRPKLEKVFNEWRQEPLPKDMFSVLKLTGFGVEDPNENPVRWDVSFETTDDDWLGIAIPFVGETAMDAQVDT
jgi:hypothetical protein